MPTNPMNLPTFRLLIRIRSLSLRPAKGLEVLEEVGLVRCVPKEKFVAVDVVVDVVVVVVVVGSSDEDFRTGGEERGGVALRRSRTVSINVSRNSFSDTSASSAASTSAALAPTPFFPGKLSLGFAKNSLSQFISAG